MNARSAALTSLGFAVFAMVAACHRMPVAATLSGNPRAAADSLQGIVRIVGSEPFPEITLSVDDGSPALRLDSASLMSKVSGTRVAVVGVRHGNRLLVDRFTVLSVHGAPAVDGILSTEGESLFLVSADGARVRLVRPPPGLRVLAGHRVWVSGEVPEQPVAYGLIK